MNYLVPFVNVSKGAKMHKLSDMIFSIKEKLTDKEFKDIMDLLGSDEKRDISRISRISHSVNNYCFRVIFTTQYDNFEMEVPAVHSFLQYYSIIHYENKTREIKKKGEEHIETVFPKFYVYSPNILYECALSRRTLHKLLASPNDDTIADMVCQYLEREVNF